MRAYVVAVGNELLGSHRTDTNSMWLAGRLAEYGVALRGKVVVGDNPDRIADAVGHALDQADLVVVTGGLGPTADDVTREAVAAVFESELRVDGGVADGLRQRFSQHGIEMAEVNLRQAMVPEGAVVLDNPLGTAPGLRLDRPEATLFLLPGVPREMRGLTEDHLLPWLAAQARLPREQVQVFRVACLAESTVEERLGPLYECVSASQVAILSRPGEVRIEVRGFEKQVDLAQMRQWLGTHLYSQGESLAETVIQQCAARGTRLAVAESCTGGQVCGELTEVPGSSAVVLGGVVAYDNRIKREQLGVRCRTLERFGAVSEETSVEMAEGLRSRFGADLTVSITGIAGPDGGSPDKPVGTVWFAWAGAGGVDALGRRFAGERQHVRAQAVQWALDGIRRRTGPAG